MNAWHFVRLQSHDGMTFTWTNLAGKTWTLKPIEVDVRGQPTLFSVGQDCPYYHMGYHTAAVEYNENGSLMSI